MNSQLDIQIQQTSPFVMSDSGSHSNNLNAMIAVNQEYVYVIQRRAKINELIQKKEESEKKKREERLHNTEEYVMHVFTQADASVEDVEKVCDLMKLFIETGQVLTDSEFAISYNKKLRNAELKQLLCNIVQYNKKKHREIEWFLLTAFRNWFKVKNKENISKNYNVLPKDSLVSKDGLEADLERLRNEM